MAMSTKNIDWQKYEQLKKQAHEKAKGDVFEYEKMIDEILTKLEKECEE